jgi:hypothetical protein
MTYYTLLLREPEIGWCIQFDGYNLSEVGEEREIIWSSGDYKRKDTYILVTPCDNQEIINHEVELKNRSDCHENA